MKDEALDFMLPDVLGKPDGWTDSDSHLSIIDKIPPDCYLWFIPIEKFDHLKDIKK